MQVFLLFLLSLIFLNIVFNNILSRIILVRKTPSLFNNRFIAIFKYMVLFGLFIIFSLSFWNKLLRNTFYIIRLLALDSFYIITIYISVNI